MGDTVKLTLPDSMGPVLQDAGEGWWIISADKYDRVTHGWLYRLTQTSNGYQFHTTQAFGLETAVALRDALARLIEEAAQ